MILHHNHSLTDLNTFRVNVKAKYFAEIHSMSDLLDLYDHHEVHNQQTFILGGGSNTLFTKDFNGLVIKVSLKGREVIGSTENDVTLKIAAGENWHEIVMWTAQQCWSGIEDMAYIPGEVGAAPVQNLAAYGQTFEDVFVSLEAVDLKTGETKIFTRDECELAYRSSIFKTKYKDKYLITSVTIRLSKFADYDTHYHGRRSYESLATYLSQIKEPPYAPIDVANAIILQRKAKLPEVSEYGTCGSVFVNPFVTVAKFRELESMISELQQYPITKMEYDRLNWHDTGQDEIVKIPAGRLLDELGWRGKWIGNVGTYEKHALIVVTNCKATGAEILAFMEQMQKSVKEAYGIDLVSEVNIL